MKILITSEFFLKLVVEGQALGLRRLGHDVGVLTRDHSFEFGGDGYSLEGQQEKNALLNRLRAAGVRVWQISGRRRFGPQGMRSVLVARREIAAWDPDVVSVHDNADPRLLLASAGRPMAYTLHDPVPHPGQAAFEPLEVLAFKLWRSRMSRLVVHSEHLVRSVPDHWARKGVTVVAHGIEVAEWSLPVPSEPRILFFGRLEPYKGLEVLLEAMKDVWSVYPTAMLTIAGRGPEASKVPSHPAITLLDRYVQEAEVSDLLASARLVVLPYTQASQSGVGLLSISKGIPIIVTTAGGLPDLVDNGAYIAECGDANSLARRIVAALDHSPTERERVLAFARRKFDWHVVAQEYLNLFGELIAEAAAS